MPALLSTDEQVSISFSCKDGIPPFLPSWVLIRPRRYMEEPAKTGIPFHVETVPVLPCDMAARIIRLNRFRLQRVSVREKQRPDSSLYTVITFMFGTDNSLRELAKGMLMLQTMLDVTWGKVSMFRQMSDASKPGVNIAFSRKVCIPNGAEYADPDDWGIKKLV